MVEVAGVTGGGCGLTCSTSIRSSSATPRFPPGGGGGCGRLLLLPEALMPSEFSAVSAEDHDWSGGGGGTDADLQERERGTNYSVVSPESRESSVDQCRCRQGFLPNENKMRQRSVLSTVENKS